MGDSVPNLITSNHVPALSEPIPSLTLKNSPSISALTLKLEAVLKDAGIPAKRFAAWETNPSKLNENLGLPHVPPTKALFEFVDQALKK